MLMNSTTERQRLISAASLLLTALVVVVLYTSLHEGGHALAGLLFGGTLTSFSINFLDISAHAGIEGSFPLWQRSVISASGALVPTVGWLVLLLCMPARVNPIAAWFRLVSSAIMCSLLVWIVFPVLYLAGQRPGDDSINFLNYSGVPPLLVSVVTLGVFAGGWLLYIHQVGGWRNLAAQVRQDRDVRGAERSSLTRILLAGTAVGAIALGLSGYFALTNPLGIPPDFTQVGSYRLAEAGVNDPAAFRINVTRPTTVEVIAVFDNVGGGTTAITLVGPAGYHFDLSNTPVGFPGSQVRVRPKAVVTEKGEYLLQVTLPRCAGKAWIGLKSSATE